MGNGMDVRISSDKEHGITMRWGVEHGKDCDSWKRARAEIIGKKGIKGDSHSTLRWMNDRAEGVEHRYLRKK